MAANGHLLDELRHRRSDECRLEPHGALRSLDEASAFLEDRGMLTRTPDCSLPSLYQACHEEPYLPGGRGFAAWPRTTWWWAEELERRPGVTALKVHRGKNLMMSPATLAVVDPICRAELARMTADATGTKFGRDTLRLLAHLAAVGPSKVEDVRAELGLTAPELRALRSPLERCGVLVARSLLDETETAHGHLHTSELARYDQLVPEPLADLNPVAALARLILAGVGAAVVAEERELSRWFSWSWYFPADLVESLVAENALARPAPGLLALGPLS